jgi:hypothetical protein
MNGKMFWGMFAVTQLLGSLSLATGSPHGNPIGLVAAMVLLFPGSILGVFALDKLGIQAGYIAILVSAVLFNIICWYGFSLAVNKYSRRKSS